KHGVVLLAGAVRSGANAVFSNLPAGARPSHITYRGVYTLDGTFGEVYIKPNGVMGVRYNGKSKAFTSLAGVAFPVPAVKQHPVTLPKRCKTPPNPAGTARFPYA